MKTIVRLASNGDYWQARWTLPGGRRVTRSIGSKETMSRRSAELQCLTIQKEIDASLHKRSGGRAPTIHEYADQYAANAHGLSDASKMIRTLVATRLKSYFKDDPRIDAIGPVQAAGFQQWLTTAKFERNDEEYTLSSASVARHVVHARAMFAQAVNEEYIARNPFAQLRVQQTRSDKAWAQVSDEDLGRIMDACPNDGWRALFALARWAGLRQGEALRLRWADVNIDTGILTIGNPTGRVSTKHRTRYTPIEPRLAVVLTRIMQDAPAGSVGPCHGVLRANLYRQTWAILKAAGVPRYHKPYHTLRKCLVTDWQAKYPPLDVAAWLGHDVRVAAEYYHRSKPETLAMVTGVSKEAIDAK